MAAKSEKWKGVKTRNLSAKQQEQAKRIVGGGRAEKVKADELKAARGTTLDINQTKWMTAKDRGGAGRGGLLTDASGKALTGTVKLASGKTATYVRGKRIGLAAAKPAATPKAKPSPVGRGGGATTTKPATTKPAASKGGTTATGKNLTARQVSAARRGEAAARRSGASRGPSALSASTIRAVGVPASIAQRPTGKRRGSATTSAAGTRVSMSSAPTPKEGQTRTAIVNGYQQPQIYKGGKWVPYNVRSH